MIFVWMRKLWKHWLFVIFYWLLTVYLEYLWMGTYISFWSPSYKIYKACLGATFYIIPYMSFAYYLAYYAMPYWVQQDRKPLIRWLSIIIPYLLVILLVIVVARLFVLPVVYEGFVKPRGFFVDPQKVVSIFVEAAFPAGLLIAIRYVESQLRSRERENALLREKHYAELQLLKNQIQPHFLFNTLNNIYSLARKKSDQTPDAIVKLSDLLSFMLYEARKDRLPLKKEISFLEDYLSLQSIRYDQRLTLRVKQDVEDPEILIHPLLLLPLVENAFKHGAGENHLDTFIDISLQVKEGWLQFEVVNSAEINYDPDKKSGIGLANLERQLALIYPEYSLKYKLHEGTYKAHLTINLSSYGKV